MILEENGKCNFKDIKQNHTMLKCETETYILFRLPTLNENVHNNQILTTYLCIIFFTFFCWLKNKYDNYFKLINVFHILCSTYIV